MKVKKYFGMALSIGLAICLSGCGEKFPELTDEQYAQTVEYAAGLLMKHSNNGQERLVYVDAKELEKQRAKEAAAAEKAAEEEKKTQKPAPKPAPAPASAVSEEEEQQFDENGQPLTTGDTPSEGGTLSTADDGESGGDDTGAFNDPDAITLSDEDTQEILDDIFLSYQGYMVSSSYPESSKSYVVNADKGKKLLVLRFDLYNGSDFSKDVNLIPINPQFEIIMNGENLGYSAVTFLPNDLSTYTGTIDSRAHESVVVLTQISADDAKNIDSLGMIASFKGQSQSVNLK